MTTLYLTENEKKLSEHINLRTYEDKYLDRKEEREILEKGLELEINIDRSLEIVAYTSEKYNIVLERQVEEKAFDAIKLFNADGVVTKTEFEDACKLMYDKSSGKISDYECQKRLKKFMVDKKIKPKQGWLFNTSWFDDIKV